MNRRRLYIPGGVLLALVLGTLYARGPAAESNGVQPRPEGAWVSLVAGQVDVVRDRGTEAREPLLGRTYVYPGDRIVTGGDGRVELTMEKPARMLRIERGSVVTVEGREKGGRIPIVGVRVDRGDVWARVSRAHEVFGLALGRVEAWVRDSVISSHRGESTRFVVFEGEAQMAESGQVLRPGQGILITATGEATPYVADSTPRNGWRVGPPG